MNIVELQRNEEKNFARKASLHLKKKFIKFFTLAEVVKICLNAKIVTS